MRLADTGSKERGVLEKLLAKPFGQFYKIAKPFLLVGVTLMSLFFVLVPTPVYAQTAGFSACQFDTKTQKAGDVTIQSCLGQIFQFTFVVGMFIIAIRIALFAIGNYNPFDNGKAVNQSIRLVWEATLGFILLGSPVLIINVFNPAALNLSFLNLSNIASSSKPAPSASGSGGSSTSSASPKKPVIAGKNGKSTAGDLKKANDKLNPKPTKNLLTNYTFAALSNSVSNQFSIDTYAQDETMTDDEAIRVLSTVLTAELECTKLFITQIDFSNCQVLDDPEFVAERGNINQRNRELYTPLIEVSRVYTGDLINTKPIEIMSTKIESNATLESCQIEYVVMKVSGDGNQHLISTEYCAGQNFDSLLWDKTGDTLTPKSGTTLDSGSQVVQNGTISLLN